MRAYLHQARLSPKKANLIASMIRRRSVKEALYILEHLPKKGAKLLYTLLTSAVANAEHNDGQNAHHLIVRTIIVNKGPAARRWMPIARGRARQIDKWSSHITLELGVDLPGETKGSVKSEGKKVAKPKKSGPPKHDDSDIVYSESKPASSHHHTQAAQENEGKVHQVDEHGHSTFQAQRKGNRGS